LSNAGEPRSFGIGAGGEEPKGKLAHLDCVLYSRKALQSL